MCKIMKKILKKTIDFTISVFKKIIEEEAKRVFEFNSQVLEARINDNTLP